MKSDTFRIESKSNFSGIASKYFLTSTLFAFAKLKAFFPITTSSLLLASCHFLDLVNVLNNFVFNDPHKPLSELYNINIIFLESVFTLYEQSENESKLLDKIFNRVVT